ncbi:MULTISPECIES: hypothetical protein [Bacteria]|uniref:hypothetical protein n=1 Tax=Bacteria TaxID=2 RepID=UPI003C7C8CAF
MTVSKPSKAGRSSNAAAMSSSTPNPNRCRAAEAPAGRWFSSEFVTETSASRARPLTATGRSPSWAKAGLDRVVDVKRHRNSTIGSVNEATARVPPRRTTRSLAPTVHSSAPSR